ncbi:unnamed protein product, partial [Arabidopsis halleri]
IISIFFKPCHHSSIKIQFTFIKQIHILLLVSPAFHHLKKKFSYPFLFISIVYDASLLTSLDLRSISLYYRFIVF